MVLHVQKKGDRIIQKSYGHYRVAPHLSTRLSARYNHSCERRSSWQVKMHFVARLSKPRHMALSPYSYRTSPWRFSKVLPSFPQLSPTNDTVFEYETLPTGFHTFRSVQHRNGQKSMYLALRDTGHIKKGSKTNRHHRSSSFLEIH